MKKLIFPFVLLLSVTTMSSGQSFKGIDKSPVDIAYLPDNFAHDRKSGDEAVIRVIYGRPQKKGREVFGNLVQYDKVWRTGANEATEIKVYKDIKIGGKSLKAGTYALFSVPGEKEWTLIFNSDLDYWGAYSYNQENDVLRVKASVVNSETEIEAFSIRFQDGKMLLGWDKTIAEVDIKY